MTSLKIHKIFGCYVHIDTNSIKIELLKYMIKDGKNYMLSIILLFKNLHTIRNTFCNLEKRNFVYNIVNK